MKLGQWKSPAITAPYDPKQIVARKRFRKHEREVHVQAGVYASRPWPFETILISILVEHEKVLVELRAKLRAMEGKESGPGRRQGRGDRGGGIGLAVYADGNPRMAL